MRCYKTYVVYKGDELKAIGTSEECAAQMKEQPRTIRWFAQTRKERVRMPNATVAYAYDERELA